MSSIYSVCDVSIMHCPVCQQHVHRSDSTDHRFIAAAHQHPSALDRQLYTPFQCPPDYLHQQLSSRCDGICGKHCPGAIAPSMPSGQPHIPHGADEEGRDRSAIPTPFHDTLQSYTCGCEKIKQAHRVHKEGLEEELVMVQDHSAWITYCTRSPSSVSFRRMGRCPRLF